MIRGNTEMNALNAYRTSYAIAETTNSTAPHRVMHHCGDEDNQNT